MTPGVVCIVGKPNVGKSTLFNRLIGSRTALVTREAGMTRDRNYGICTWQERVFTLIDTGGLDISAKSGLLHSIREQVEFGIEEANLILFVVDARRELNGVDQEIGKLLRKKGKKVILCINKVDKETFNWLEYTNLGFKTFIPISALHGLNIPTLLNEIVKELPVIPESSARDYLKVAIVGRPNVGKSTLVNRIVGEKRVVVDTEPGTTRDAVDVLFKHDSEEYLLIDTAGIRHKAPHRNLMERLSILKAIKSINRAEVVLLMLDATEGLTTQDKRILSYIQEAGRAGAILVNKWDKVNSQFSPREYIGIKIEKFLGKTRFPILTVSALTGLRVNKIFEIISQLKSRFTQEIPAEELNEMVKKIILKKPPPLKKGKEFKFYSAFQICSLPLTFVIVVNQPSLFKDSYLRYIENNLRRKLSLKGVPVKIIVKKR
jgi:GTP-binding protein